MEIKKSKKSLKVALASTLAVTATAGIVYTTPKVIETIASEEAANIDFILRAESIDKDTVKVCIDNVKEIPKSLQFSIQLEGVIPKFDGSNLSIKDLIKEDTSNNVITSYTYNRENNTIDVLVTSIAGINKAVGNTIEVFELDVEKKSDNNGREYKIKEVNGSDYKYLAINNQEFEGEFSSEDKTLIINSMPIIEKKEDISYIDLEVNEKVSLTEEKLKEYITFRDEDGDSLKLIVKDKDGKELTGQEFSKSKVGVYDLYITVNDGFVDSKAVILQVKVNNSKVKPSITKDNNELKDIVIKPGQFKTREELLSYLREGVKAVDKDNKELEVKIEIDENIDLNSEEPVSYLVRYSTTDESGIVTIKEITLTIANEEEVPDEDNGNQGGNEGTETPDGDNGNQGGNEGTETPGGDNGNQGGNEGTETPGGDNGNQGGNEGTETPGGDNGNQGGNIGEENPSIIPDFIQNIINDDTIEKVQGEATQENPLVIKIKNVSIKEFNVFIEKIKELKPILIDKYNKENYTVYKIKLQEKESLIQRIFRSRKSSNEAVVEILVYNTLEYQEYFNNMLERLLVDNTVQNPEDNNQDGAGEIETPNGDNGNQGGNGEVTTPDLDNGSQGQNEEAITPDKNKEDNGIKLPITGQESILGYVAAVIIAIGGVLFFYKKKK